MATPEKDIKKLWGLAAGRCSRPGCPENLIVLIDANDPTVLGEMAHVIDRAKNGKARGTKKGGTDTYENLILLCPTHHTLIDRAPPGTYPVETLLKWKAVHESAVKRRLEAPIYSDKRALCARIMRLLMDNRATWKTYGPESDIAQASPLSNAVRLWMLRKLSEIVPRNEQIVNLVRQNNTLFSTDEYELFTVFEQHAVGFQAHCYARLDAYERYPVAFEGMVRRVCEG